MDAEATRAAVVESDAAVAVILAALAAAPFPTALFVTTDHGMRPVPDIVNIRRILYNHAIDAEPVSTGTTSFLYFRDPGRSGRGADRRPVLHRRLVGFETEANVVGGPLSVRIA